MIKEKILLAALTFSILLNFKHIFLYFAPAYFIYILKNYVLKENPFSRFVKVGVITILPIFLSFLPFIIIGFTKKEDNEVFNFSQIKQIFSRMFPVERGLVHSYWAPNFYPIYLVLDKLLTKIFFSQSMNDSLNKSTLGLVKIIQTDNLPNINAFISNLIVISLLVILMNLYAFKKSTSLSEIFKLLFMSGFIFFNFGYHVHEKALISISLIALLFYFFKANEHNYINKSYIHIHGKSSNNSEIQNEDENEVTVEMLKSPNLISKSIFENKELITIHDYATFFDLVCFFTQLPLVTNVNDYYKKIILIIFVVGINVYFKKIRSNKILIYVLVFIFLDFYYVIGRNLLINNRYYYNMILKIFESLSLDKIVSFNTKTLTSTIILDKILNMEFLHLLLMSLINSIILQILFVYFMMKFFI